MSAVPVWMISPPTLDRLAPVNATRSPASTGLLDNGSGLIASNGALALSGGTIDNREGVIAAQQNLVLQSGTVDNRGGILAALTGDTVLASSGATDNRDGRIEAAGGMDIAAGGMVNTGGMILASRVAIDNGTAAFDNRNGVLIAADDVTVTGGEVNNAGGLIQSGGELQIDTRGAQLINTASGNTGGLIGNEVRLSAGTFDNKGGFAGSAGALHVNADTIDNRSEGSLVAGGSIFTSAASLDNRGGQLQALDEIRLDLSGSLNNEAGLLRADQALVVHASGIVNGNTLDPDTGIEGGTVELAAHHVDNTAGAIRADDQVLIRSGGTIDNSGGLISAQGTVQLQDAGNATRTLSISNAGGTMIAGESLGIDALEFSGAGQLLSQGDLTLTLAQNFTDSGQILANGNATVETTGRLTNTGAMAAGTSLAVSAGTIDNRAGGELRAPQLHLQALDPNTLVNRGLIDGFETRIDTVTLHNLGTGRIYGDHVAIAADTLINGAENGAAAVIAGRDRVDIGAGTITNRDHALIFSAGDMAIGGALDANGLAIGQAGVVNNNSATVEALGDLSLSANRINNTNDGFGTTVSSTGSQHITEYVLAFGDVYRGRDLVTRHSPDDVSIWNCQSYCMTVLATGDTSDSFVVYSYTRSQSETVVATSDPGRILAGANMSITADTVENDKSQIIAGGTIAGNIGTLLNTEVAGQRTITDSGAVTSYWRHRLRGRDTYGSSSSGYNPAPTVQAISLSPSVYQAQGNPTGTGTQIDGFSASTVSSGPDQASSAVAVVDAGTAVAPITQVPALVAAGEAAAVVRSGGINPSIPANSLFQFVPDPASRYFVETDPRFADYRSWLSSDYLLNALAIDPATSQKRLGDGFYEQRLIREQIAQLTGRRFLDGYADDEAQYLALMQNAVAYAQEHQLRPGIALSAEQMAALTSDLVWLVEQQIQLPDGQTVTALVPQLYVRVQDGDLHASGALISADRINLNLTNDLVNSGAIVARQSVAIGADNIRNLGGRILGQDIGLQAATDIDNIGGRIAADNSLVALAGRDINVVSTTRSQSNAQGSRTNIDRVATLSVTGGDGLLVASAGRDLTLNAAAVSNSADPAAGGATVLAAGNNLTLGTVTQSDNNSIAWNANNWRKESSSTEAGSVIATSGDLVLQAGADVTMRAASVQSEQGTLTVAASGDVRIESGLANQTVDAASQTTSKGTFSKRTYTTRATVDQSDAIASSLGGQTVQVQSGRDLAVIGSDIVSTDGTTLAAAGNVTIEAAIMQSSDVRNSNTLKSGMFSSGGFGVTIGKQEQTTKVDGTSTHASASTIGAIDGNVTIAAGGDYRQVGSQVLAPGGDIAIAASRIDIEEARETNNVTQVQTFKQSGLTVAISSPVLNAIQTVQQMKEASGKTSDGRMQLLAGASSALAVKNAADAIKQGQGTTVNGKEGQIVTGKNADGKLTSRDANAADQAGGINISISIGSSKSESTTTQRSDTAAGSTVLAGGDILLTASGAGEHSNLTIQGSTVQAAGNVTLQADNQLKLLAAANTSEQHTTSSSKSGSIGVSFGTDGFLITAGASKGRGKADGDDVSWTNTHVEAGNTLILQSGSDTTMKGAVASGNQVIADIGGNLHIESLQDTSRYHSQQQNIGGSISVGFGKMGGSLSISKSKVDSDYASVAEQSSIKAGDGGYDVRVAGNADLIGGVIAASDQALADGKTHFKAGGDVTLTDIANHANYDARSTGISLNAGVSKDFKSGFGGGFGKESDSQSSVTQAGIGVSTSTDTTAALSNRFDADRVQANVDAQMQITMAFTREAPKALAQYADQKAVELRKQGNEEEALKWEEGGAYRIAAHAALGGLSGGLAGALGAGVGASVIADIGEAIAELNLPEPVRQGLTAVAGATVGAAVGALAGDAGAGAITSTGQTVNNYFSRSPFREVQRAVNQENARLTQACEPNCTQEDYRRIDQQMFALERTLTLNVLATRSTLTDAQAREMAQLLVELAPFYGTGESLVQLVTGRSSITGEEASRFWAAVGVVPLAGGVVRKVGEPSVEALSAVLRNEAAAGKLTSNGLTDSVWHATASSRAAQGVLNGIDPAYLNPNSRFGAAFYVAEQPGTTIAELVHHGVDATHGIRFELNKSAMKVLDLTNPEIAAAWGYTGGPINSVSQKIGVQAQDQGFNVIRYYSERATGGINNAVLDDFNKILKPISVVPVKP